MRMLLRNGRVIDPSRNVDETLDVLVEGGRIARLDVSIPKIEGASYELAGCSVAPQPCANIGADP